MGTMSQGLFEVECPCCSALLKIDPETRAVIAHTVPVKPPPIEDLAAAVAKLKGEAGTARRGFPQVVRGGEIARKGASRRSLKNCSNRQRRIPT